MHLGGMQAPCMLAFRHSLDSASRFRVSWEHRMNSGSLPFALMTVSGRALAAGSGRIQNPQLAPCGSLNTRLNTNGGEPEF